jgi:hypothetical protein
MYNLVLNELNKDRIDKIDIIKWVLPLDIDKCEFDKTTGILTYKWTIDLDNIKKLNS